MPEGVTAPAETPSRVVGYLGHVVEVFRTADLDAMGDLVTPDCAFIDHRPLGADPVVGTDAIRAWFSTIFEMLPDWHIEIEVLAARGDVYLARDTYSGTAVAGGPALMEWYVVDTLRGDRLEREEMFADETSARAAYEAASRDRAVHGHDVARR